MALRSMFLYRIYFTVAPDAIHHHVKSYRANMKNMHFVAPEYGSKSGLVQSTCKFVLDFIDTVVDKFHSLFLFRLNDARH